MAESPSTPRASPSLTPMQRVAARVYQRQQAQSNDGHGGNSAPGSPIAGGQNLPPPTSQSNTDEDAEPSSPVDTTRNAVANAFNAQGISLAYLAPSLKRARKLGPQSGTELDIYLASSALEQAGHHYALALACHDKLSSLVTHLDYKVPTTLTITARDYAWAFMLSPTIASYRYPKTPSVILDVMQDLNVTDVPPLRETGRCAQIEKVIRNALTQCRHHIKDKISDTFKPGPDDATDIASLTALVVSSTKVKATAAVYMRIAFIRWVAQEWPELREDEDFWLKVDEQLREQVAEFKTPSKIQEACQTIYDANKLQFGQPDLISHPMVAAHLQDDWIMILGDKSTTLPQKAPSRKRARADADDV